MKQWNEVRTLAVTEGMAGDWQFNIFSKRILMIVHLFSCGRCTLTELFSY